MLVQANKLKLIFDDKTSSLTFALVKACTVDSLSSTTQFEFQKGGFCHIL